MGLVLLAGIVVDNGIVLIAFVNQEREEKGVTLEKALTDGCLVRLRPIMMTALTTILGMLPLALGIGEGAAMQAPMAIVIVSGLLVSTFLTLIVIPTLYVLMEDNVFKDTARKKISEKFKSIVSALKKGKNPSLQ
jgi:HAE1 family hydrophobic/amphiphilic exporter-1